MFYGVNEKPFLDLSPYLDLSRLDGVIDEVMTYINGNPRFELVPFTPAQEIHRDNPNAKFLCKAIRLRSLAKESADGLEIEGKNTYAALCLPKTMEFLSELPLRTIGRSSIYFTEPGEDVPTHRDYAQYPGFNNQFIYFNPLNKPFFIIGKEGNKHFIDTPASIFNPSDFHGMMKSQEQCFSLRVNGFWNKDLVETTGLEHYFKRL